LSNRNMGLLAGDRKKQRWSTDPRGRKWAADKNKISNKLMEKMGWKEGEGLGKEGDGMLNPIGVKYKMDNLGFGCTQKYDKQWVAHQDSFNDLLAGLSAESTTATETTDSKPVLADKAKISSLGQTGKKSGHRYHKFTKAKDLSQASAKDMEGIFGRSSVSEAKAVQTEENRAKAEEEKAAPKFEESTQHVRQTENVHEYFKRKMAERMARMSGVKTEPIEEAEQLMIKSEPAADSDEREENTEGQQSEPAKKKKKSKKTKSEPIEEADVKVEPVDDEAEVAHEEVEVKKKKKKKRKKEAPVEEAENEEEVMEQSKPKKKKNKVEAEEEVNLIEKADEVKKEKKSKKKKKKQVETDE